MNPINAMSGRVTRFPPLRIRRALQAVFASWQLYALLAPAVVYLFVFHYIPLYGVQIAFKDFRTSLGIWGSKWVGLKHFIRFVNLPIFWRLVGNTLSITLYSLATFPLPVIFALLINELDNVRFKKAIQMISYAPHFISTVVICSMITLFFGRASGLVNNILAHFGGQRIDFLTIPACFADLFVWSGVWQGLGWGSIIYLAALSGVSPELVEAARIDGATRLQVVRHVNLPTILPTIVIMLIMRCGSLFSLGFEKVYLLQNALNLDASQVISTYVYEIGLQGGQYSLSSAIGLFNNLINILMLLIVNGIVRRVSEISLW